MRIAMLGIRCIPTELPAQTQPADDALPVRDLIGGAERATEKLAVGLAARGHEVTVLCRKGRSLITDPCFEGVNLEYLPCIASKHLEAISHTALATAKLLVQRKYDLLHYHATGPTLLSIVPRLMGTPTVATVQGLDWQRDKWGSGARVALRAAAWSAATFPHRTIVVSRTLERHYREHYARQVQFIPNGVERPQRADIDELRQRCSVEPGRYVLFLSRLVPEKGAHLLLDAFRDVKTDLRLLVAGGGSYSGNYLTQLRDQAARDDRVILEDSGLYGSLKQAAFSHAALFVLPSRIEGLSIALLEAMSYGLPPLTSDIPENREVVEPAGGFTFRDGDVEDLRRRLQQLVDDQESRQRAGTAAARHVELEYGWDGIVERTEALYQQLLISRAPQQQTQS